MDRHAPGSLEALRQRNRDAVVRALRTGGLVSRAEVARRTGLSRSTVSTVVADLIRADIVRETTQPDESTTGSGRPGTPLTLNLSAGAVIALDLDTRGLSGAIFDLGHHQLAMGTLAFDTRSTSLDQIVDAADALTNDLLTQADVDRASIIGAAMGVPAPIEQQTRRVGLQSGIPAIVGGDVEPRIAAMLRVPFTLENDANLSALAEWTDGAAAGHMDAIYVEISDGIGAGLIIGGRLHRGARGTAGEIGHTPVVVDGPLCRCGNRGCLELVAGVTAITEAVNEQLDETLTIEQIVERVTAGDPMCRRIMRDAAAHVGTVIGSMCNLINPTVVIVGGAITPVWSMIESALHDALDRAAIHVSIKDLKLVPSTQANAVGRLIGARTLVLADLERFPVPRAA